MYSCNINAVLPAILNMYKLVNNTINIIINICNSITAIIFKYSNKIQMSDA